MRKATHRMDPRTDYLRELGYEPRDVALRSLVRWLIGLFVFIVVTAVVTLGIYYLFVQPGTQPMNSPENAVAPRRLPPAPNPVIQPEPRTDLRNLRTQEAGRLDSYGWVDEQKGIARIPVDRAIDILAQRGLPASAQPTGPIPGEASVAVQAGAAAYELPPATQTSLHPDGGTVAPGTPIVPPAPPVPAGETTR